ncbi:MAG: GNAT family N-acetyltransferase [Flavisolibacter sp.]
MVSITVLSSLPSYTGEAAQLLIEYGNYLFEELKLMAGRENFWAELKTFPHPFYEYPDGAFIIALSNGKLIGCTGIRKYNSQSVEMKRMYVHPEFRGLGTGKLLSNYVIAWARKFNYRKILLDTNMEMPAAISVYRKLGFTPIVAYCKNENPNPVFMEYQL